MPKLSFLFLKLLSHNIITSLKLFFDKSTSLKLEHNFHKIKAEGFGVISFDPYQTIFLFCSIVEIFWCRIVMPRRVRVVGKLEKSVGKP
jgi:hypothetical protein